MPCHFGLRIDHLVMYIFPCCPRGAQGILLLYDITNEKSFDNIKTWIHNIEQHASEDVEKMILGNKCDMEEKRVISTEQGQKLAEEHGVEFMETSAKANINVEEAFVMIARKIKVSGRCQRRGRRRLGLSAACAG